MLYIRWHFPTISFLFPFVFTDFKITLLSTNKLGVNLELICSNSKTSTTFYTIHIFNMGDLGMFTILFLLPAVQERNLVLTPLSRNPFAFELTAPMS